MTKDPIEHPPLNARREIIGNRHIFTVWADEITASITIEYDVDKDGLLDDRTLTLLRFVINEDFSRNMMLEFATADLIKKETER